MRALSTQGSSVSSSGDMKEVTRPAVGPGDKGSKLGNVELEEKWQQRHLQYLFSLHFAKPLCLLAEFNAVLLLISLTLEINHPLEK